ncbi:MAG TPA: GH25 family lysozyme [Verrucomicrobiae bacterium]|nr:GH25 family lysozyme [Verrucomicrobiae bacterium]
MVLFGVDLHPSYQSGISIDQIHKEGFSFVICKLSQGKSSASYAGSIPWLKRAKQLGMAGLGYHYLTTDDPVAQAQCFAKALMVAGVPGCLDVEQGSGDIKNVKAFLDEAQRLGAKIPLLYLPRWYWQQIGSPSLKDLPALWSSRYPDNNSGYASNNYQRVPANFWDGYGGNSVAVLQFTSSAKVAGHTTDANAFKGTLSDFNALVNGTNTPAPSVNPAPAVTIDTSENGFLMALSEDEQKEALSILRNLNFQLYSGNTKANPDGKPGWPSFEGGSNEVLTVVDYLRRSNERMEALTTIINDAVGSATTTPTSTTDTTNSAPTPLGDEAQLAAIVKNAVLEVLTSIKLTPSE